VDPLDIQGAEDATGISTLEAQNVDLDHLRHVLEEVPSLGDDEQVERRQPLVPTIDPGHFTDSDGEPRDHDS